MRWVALVGLAGCSDYTVGSESLPPTAEIALPVPGVTVAEGATITVEGVIDDRDTLLESYEVRWYAGPDPVCLASRPDADGVARCTTPPLREPTTIVLAVESDDGVLAQASVDVDVLDDGPPLLRIVEPAVGGVVPTQAPTLKAVVSDAEEDAWDLAVGWDSDVDGPLPVTPTDDHGVVLADADLSPGVHVLTFWAEDALGQRTEATVVVSAEDPG